MSVLSNKAIYKEIARRKKLIEDSKPLELDTNFKAQTDFVEDASRFIIAQCSRRAGKSNALALKFFRTMEKYPGSQCLYLALTRDSARAIMWPVLQEHNEKYKVGCTFLESRLTMTHPNGAKLRLLGADSKNLKARFKGIKSPGVAIDEAQDFGSHLQALIDEALSPTIADYDDGWLAMTGTPGPVPSGYFFDATQNAKYGYSVHRWTVLENPHMPKAHEFIEGIKQKFQWEDNHPTLLREWKNKWVLDAQSLWIAYNEKKSHYDTLPKLPGNASWNYILGIDVGYRDADALAVLAWSESLGEIYLVEEVVERKQDITDLVNKIEGLRKKYPISKMVIDTGANGKKIAEEMIRRHKIPVQAADKQRKQENVTFLNDWLRLGKFKAKSTSKFAQDSYLIQIDWDKSSPDKIVIKKTYHSDIIDAVLYAFKESPAYSYETPAPKLVYGSPEWVRREEELMYEASLQEVREQNAAEAEDIDYSQDPYDY
jgi:hypothetical protein